MSKEEKKQRVRTGMKMEVESAEFHKEIHTIKSVEINPYNEIVPYSIETCCGKYIPTSMCDGYWERSMNLGGWELLEELQSVEARTK